MKALNFTVLAVFFLLASCATAPTAKVESPRTLSAPEWTSRTIFMEGSDIVFVLAGPEKADVVSLALQAMTSYLDLPVVPATPVVAAQAVQQFLQAMSKTSPSDRFTKDGRSYWKISVPKETWEKSRGQLKDLFQPADPAAELEKAGDELLKQGRYFDAVTAYVGSAAAAVATDKPVARFKASLAKAQEILAKLTLTSSTPALTTRVGQPLGATFDVKLSYGAGASAPVVPGAQLRFSYKTKKNGRLAVTGQTIKTDSLGMVQFELPIPDFAVRDSVVVLVDVNPWLEALAQVPKELRESVSLLETLSGDRKLQLPYSVDSASKQVPMIVALADFDDKGVVQRRQETSSAMIAAFQKAGFQASGIPVNPTLLKSPNDGVILAAWKFQGKSTGRAVFGTVSLVTVTLSGSQYNAEVTGTVKVADLATGKVVYQATNTKVVAAADKATAVMQGYRQWAVDAVASMESELP